MLRLAALAQSTFRVAAVTAATTAAARPAAMRPPAFALLQRCTMAVGRNRKKLRELREQRLQERERREAAERGPEVLDFSPKALGCDVLTAIEREEMYLRDKEREPIPMFYAGSSIRVTFRSNLDSDTERHSVGLCIARTNRKLGSTFTLRNVENGVPYEQKWELYSPHIQKIVVLELARRRRAKLYYMRDRPAKESYVNPRMQPIPTPEGPVPVKKPVNNRKTRLKRIALRQSKIRRTKEIKARTSAAARSTDASPQDN